MSSNNEMQCQEGNLIENRISRVTSALRFKRSPKHNFCVTIITLVIHKFIHHWIKRNRHVHFACIPWRNIPPILWLCYSTLSNELVRLRCLISVSFRSNLRGFPVITITGVDTILNLVIFILTRWLNELCKMLHVQWTNT